MACSNDGNGGSGANLNQIPAFNSTVLIIAPAGDGTGDVYVGGDFTSYNGIAVTRLVRLNADGTVDPVLVTGVGFNGAVRSIASVGDGTGDLYVGGDFTSYRGIAVAGLVRLNADGTVDPALVTGVGFNGAVRSIASVGDGSGDLYVGGDFSNYRGIAVAGLVRLNADGTVDPVLVTGTGFTDTVHRIAPASDGTGDLYVGGAFTSYNGTSANDLVRLN
ncbi:MAG TPA: delta-60 repeat domain-containing protein, partial [Nitrospira sp.]|nr:delta-60 repeat domain-containing protein [Nitrospira sp.]